MITNHGYVGCTVSCGYGTDFCHYWEEPYVWCGEPRSEHARLCCPETGPNCNHWSKSSQENKS